MDVTKLLPLIGGDYDSSALLSAFNERIDKSAAAEKLLRTALSKNNPQMAKLTELISAMLRPSPKNHKCGIQAVSGIATDEIIGRLFKLLS